MRFHQLQKSCQRRSKNEVPSDDVAPSEDVVPSEDGAAPSGDVVPSEDEAVPSDGGAVPSVAKASLAIAGLLLHLNYSRR